MDDARLSEYRMLWTEPGWSLWRTQGGRLIPINPEGQIGVDLRAFDDDPAFAAVVVETMVAAGVAVSDERPETVRDLPAPPHGEYLMWRVEPAAVIDGWDEWASWVVLDPDGLPVGTIDESTSSSPTTPGAPPPTPPATTRPVTMARPSGTRPATPAPKRPTPPSSQYCGRRTVTCKLEGLQGARRACFLEGGVGGPRITKLVWVSRCCLLVVADKPGKGRSG